MRSKPQVKLHDVRTCSGYLYFPRRCQLRSGRWQWRWLEYAKWTQVYTAANGVQTYLEHWKNTSWLDTPILRGRGKVD